MPITYNSLDLATISDILAVVGYEKLILLFFHKILFFVSVKFEFIRKERKIINEKITISQTITYHLNKLFKQKIRKKGRVKIWKH